MKDDFYRISPANPVDCKMYFLILRFSLLASVLTQCSGYAKFSIVPASKMRSGDFWSKSLGENYWGIINSSKVSRDAFPSISNLDAIVAPFVGQKCVVHIDNFFFVNIDPVAHPVYLRKPELAYSIRSWYPTICPTWLLEQVIHRNITIDWRSRRSNSLEELMSYKLYPKQDDIQNIYPVLRPINFFHHSVNTKPWNCYVHVLLFPPFINSTRLALPPTMWYPFAPEQLAHQLPSRVPAIALFVFEPSIHHDVGEEDFILGSHFPPSEDATSNYIFLAVNVTYSSRDFAYADHRISTAFIKDVKVVQLCPACITHSDPRMGGISDKLAIKLDTLKSMTALESLAFPDSNAGLLFGFDDLPHSVEIGTVKAYLKECVVDQSFHLATKPSILALPERRTQARANIWLSIMKNYSIIIHYYHVCVNGKTVSIGLGPNSNPDAKLLRKLLVNSGWQSALQFQVSVENDLDSLQFVSCGKRGFHSISYHELLKLFDKYVWIFLVINYAGVLPLMIWKFRTFSFVEISGMADRILVGCKILLEQSDKAIIRSKTFGAKAGFGVFILLGVVLTNAYKNCNVYNMISHRDAIPYETLDELVQDEFKVYSRITDLDIRPYFYNPQLDNLDELELYMFRHKIHDSNMRWVSAYSEVHVIKSRSDKGGNSSEVSKLHTHSCIFAGMMKWLRKMAQGVLFSWQSNSTWRGIFFIVT